MKHLRKQIAGYLLTLILLMAGIVFPGSGEKVLASGGSMTVHFLDVGQGLSILVQSEGQNLLYDGGPRSASSYVVSYLQEQNVSEIDYLISSHYDEDPCEAVNSPLWNSRRLPVEWEWLARRLLHQLHH